MVTAVPWLYPLYQTGEEADCGPELRELLQQTAKPKHEVWEPPRCSRLEDSQPCNAQPAPKQEQPGGLTPGPGRGKWEPPDTQRVGDLPTQGSHVRGYTAHSWLRCCSWPCSRYASGQTLAIPTPSRTTMDRPLQLWLGALASNMPGPPAAVGTPVCPELGQGSHPHLCDSELLLCHIARHIDHLHPVPQRLGDGLGDVGCADEQHLGRPAGRFWRTSPPASPHWAWLPGWTHIPWTGPRAHPSSDPGSWHSARGPAAQAALTTGPPGSPGLSCPPEGAAQGGCSGHWSPLLTGGRRVGPHFTSTRAWHWVSLQQEGCHGVV